MDVQRTQREWSTICPVLRFDAAIQVTDWNLQPPALIFILFSDQAVINQREPRLAFVFHYGADSSARTVLVLTIAELGVCWGMVLCNQDNGELELIGRKIRFMSVRNCVQSFQDEYYRRIQTIYKHSSQTDREPLVRILKTSRNIEMDENSIKRENCSLRFDFHSPRKSVKFRKQINYYVIMCMATDFFYRKKYSSS